MTNEEAIKTLEANYPDACFEQLREAVDAAIEALKAQDADSDTISRKAAIDAILAVTGNSSVRELYEHVQEHGLSDMWSGGVNAAIDIIIAVPSAQPDLIAKIQNGINATNANDSYSCGMRNGMRWCMSLVDDKEPLFENCPSAQPTGTPLHDNESDYSHGFADGYKQGLKDAESERVRCKDCKQFRRWIDTDISFCDITEAEMSDNDFCSKAERITDEM